MDQKTTKIYQEIGNIKHENVNINYATLRKKFRNCGRCPEATVWSRQRDICQIKLRSIIRDIISEGVQFIFPDGYREILGRRQSQNLALKYGLSPSQTKNNRQMTLLDAISDIQVCTGLV